MAMKIVKKHNAHHYTCDGKVSVELVQGRWIMDLDCKQQKKHNDQLIPCESLSNALTQAEGYLMYCNYPIDNPTD